LRFFVHRVLEVFLLPQSTTREGISALSKLQSLQEFYFFESPNMCKRGMIRVAQLCLELLPQLHGVMLKVEPHSCKNLLRILGNYTSSALSGLSTDRQYTLQLRNVAVSGAVPEQVSMPELRCLCHSWPSEHTALGLDNDRFPRLRELAMYGVCQTKLMRNLGHVGRQLEALHFEVHAIVQLDRVLEKCPDLSELSVHSHGLNSAAELQPRPLRRLDKLKVYFADSEYEHQPGLFVEILRHALELRSVDLTLQKVHADMFEELCVLIKQRTCMRHLEEFTVYVDNDQCDKFERAVPEIALVLCAYECEKLKKVMLEFKKVTESPDE
jgi:hypothetical protein